MSSPYQILAELEQARRRRQMTHTSPQSGVYPATTVLEDLAEMYTTGMDPRHQALRTYQMLQGHGQTLGQVLSSQVAAPLRERFGLPPITAENAAAIQEQTAAGALDAVVPFGAGIIKPTKKALTEKKALDVAGGNFGSTFVKQTALTPYEAAPGASYGAQGGLKVEQPTKVLYEGTKQERRVPTTEALVNQDVQQQYFHDVNRVLTDEWGNDVIAREIGLLQFPGYRGQGIWLDQTNPNAVTVSAVPLVRGPDADQHLAALGLGRFEVEWSKPGDGKRRIISNKLKDKPGSTQEEKYLAFRIRNQVDPAARDLLDANAIAHGYALSQDGASWVRPIQGPNVRRYASNYGEVALESLPREELLAFSKEFDRVKTAMGLSDEVFPVIPTERGLAAFRPVNFDKLTPSGAKEAIKMNQKFQQAWNKTLKTMVPRWRNRGYGDAQVTLTAADSAYFEHQPGWGTETMRDKMDYRRNLERMRPELQQKVTATLQRVNPEIDYLSQYYRQQYPLSEQRAIASKKQRPLAR